MASARIKSLSIMQTRLSTYLIVGTGVDKDYSSLYRYLPKEHKHCAILIALGVTNTKAAQMMHKHRLTIKSWRDNAVFEAYVEHLRGVAKHAMLDEVNRTI